MKLDEKIIGPYTVTVWADDNPSNPFEDWDAMPTILHWHRNYNLGDRYTSHFLQHPFDEREEALQAIRDEYGCTVILPLYLYDHSGISVSTKPFSCAWDSGQVGFIFFTPESLRQGWGDNPPSDADLPDIIAASLDSFDKYLRGDVYGYTVTGPDIDESCGGFYDEIDDVMREGESYVDENVVAEYEHMQKMQEKYPGLQSMTIC